METSASAFPLLASRLALGEGSVECLLLSSLPGLAPGHRWILDKLGRPVSDALPDFLSDALREAALGLGPGRRVGRVEVPGPDGTTVEVYLERWVPEPRVLVLGGGHVGRSLVTALRDLGFRILVAEDRPYFARPERFEGTVGIVEGALAGAAERIDLGSEDYAVIVTRGHREDLDCLRSCLARRPRYLGLLGSRRKLREFRRVLAGEGVAGELLDRVRCPVGLPIGAETPAEIAVAVAAELVAVRAGRDPRSREDKCPQDGA